MLVKILAKDDKDLAKIKTVYIASSLNEDIIFNPENLGFNEGTFSPLKSLNLNQIGCLYADKTIIVNGAEKVSPKLKKLKVFKDAKNCSVVDLDYGDNTDYAPLLDAIELGIKKI
jgi:starch synthase